MMDVLADPVFLTLAAVATGLGLLLLGRRAAGAALILIALAGLYLLSTPVASSRLMAWVEPEPVAWPAVLERIGKAPEGERPQAIVVLSSGLQLQPEWLGGDVVVQSTLERLAYAARLRRATGLPILVAGGSMWGAKKTLAAAMAETLTRDFGVPVAWQQTRSHSTEDDARFSREMLAPLGVDRIFLVTDPSHMPRAARAFARAGFEVTPMATVHTFPEDPRPLTYWLPRSAALDVSARAMRELATRIAYRWLYER